MCDPDTRSKPGTVGLTRPQQRPVPTADNGDLDSVVVGGGLAGGAAALELARGGRRVTLIERTPAPRHKVCGDFLSGEAATLLLQLGLNPLAFGATKIARLRLICGRRVAESPLPFVGLGLSRMQLDQALLDLAVDAGVQLIRGETASAMHCEGGRVVIKTGHRRLTARTALLATGKHALRTLPRPGGRSTAFKSIFTADADILRRMRDSVQLVAYEGGYIGAVIVEHGLISMAWLLRSDLLGSIGTEWAEQATFLARQSPPLAELIAGIKPTQAKPLAVSNLPYGFLRHQAIAANVYAVGDQLAVVPSLTGDGTAIALASGIKAAQAIMQGIDAQTFQTGLIGRLRLQFRVAGLLQAAFESPLARRLGILAAASAPALVRAAVRRTRLRV